MSAKETAKGCSTLIIILFGIGFVGMAVETLFGFLFGGKSFISDFLDPDSEGTNLSIFRFKFWTLIVGIVVFFLTGGKIEDIFGRKNNK